MNEQLMTVDHFGSGGRRSDSRLGRRGEKLGDCGEIAISEIHRFFMDLFFFKKGNQLKIRKFQKSRFR